MKLNPFELAEIVLKSQSFYERIENAKLNKKNVAAGFSLRNSEILKTWQQEVIPEDKNGLKKHFRWDNLKLSQVYAALSLKTLNGDLPEWSFFLQQVFENADETKNNYAYIYKKNPLPFEELLIPFIEIALHKLKKKLSLQKISLNTKVFEQLTRSLLKKLSDVSAFTFNKEFEIFKYTHGFYNGDFIFSKDSKKYYSAYIRWMLVDNFQNFFKCYPVLARLLSILPLFWINNYSQVFTRLKNDLPSIQTFFQRKISLTKLASVATDLSDSHNFGKTVIIFTFDKNFKLVYKPRSLKIELAYFHFLDWVNAQGLPLKLSTIQTLAMKDYGWQGYVTPKAVKDKKAIRNYYYRIGSLISIIKVIAGTDFHQENIIANGEFPVLIDLETLIQPKTRSFSKVEGLAGGWVIENSVFQSGLLPFGEKVVERFGVDISGIASGDIQKHIYHAWDKVNKDNMQYCKAMKEQRKRKLNEPNLPYLKNKKQYPNSYLTEIIKGFREAYHLLMTGCHDVKSGMQDFQNVKARYVFRATQTYFIHLKGSLAPEYMQDGIKRSIYLDKFARYFLSLNKKSYLWPIIKDEHQALTNYDIPYFKFDTNDKSFVFCKSGYQTVLDNFKKLSQQDCDFQCELITRTIKARFTKTQQLAVKRTIKSVKHVDDVIITNEVYRIADDLIANAKVSGEKVAWLQGTVSENEKYCLQYLSHDLYNGVAGVAFFLAAAGKTLHNDEYKALALKAIEPFAKYHADEDAKYFMASWGVGGVVGLGSVIYALTKVSIFLDEPKLLSAANSISKLFTDDLIAADKSLDIIAGSAGAILALLCLYRYTQNQKVLSRAIACGEHLLENRTESNTGHKVWKTISDNKSLLVGFSHGATGIGYALLKLYEQSKQAKFLEAAKEALAYENSVFCNKEKNWPDLRADSKKLQFGIGWCHGSAGIGLARLGSLISYGETIQKDIDYALRHALTKSIGLDHICCGNFGVLDFLVEASQKLVRPDLHEIAKQKAAGLIIDASKNGGFLFTPPGMSVFGLFRGTTGVGYELLRMIDSNLPSVLLLQ